MPVHAIPILVTKQKDKTQNTYLLPLGSDLRRLCQILKAILIPPLSARFSPSVNSPSKLWSSPLGPLMVKFPYWLTKHWAFSSKACDVAFVHHYVAKMRKICV